MNSASTSRSDELLARASALMPWGTQTNAKRLRPELADVMPAFFVRGDGCRLQDVEGDWYLDFRCALGPIILGYCHPEVDEAVRRQMANGVLFSMASPIELEVAERMVDLVPGLEQVRFMKTGNDANSAAVRIARAYTGRDHLITCGYHGYSDWFASGSGSAPTWYDRKGNGVPAALDELVSRVAYGDTQTAEALFGDRGDRIAAMIMVPYDWEDNVASDFVHRMRALTTAHGSLLIFDQVLTGFRLALGGAQEYFGVTPDLTTYAKAMANGYPVSAFGGRRDVMQTLERMIITTTYAGETLSLAASSATLDVLRRDAVNTHIWEMGRRLQVGFDTAAADAGLEARAYGLPPAVQFRFSEDPEREAKAQHVFHRELYRRRIFASKPFLISFAHKEADIDEALVAINAALEVVRDEVPALAI